MVNESGKILHIDPNEIFNSGGVDVEDLSILVELTAFKPNKSTIVDSNLVTTTTSTNSGVINFIGGSDTNGDGSVDSLTTSYTELNTTFSKSGDNIEGLGLTKIDIDFNSSMMPVITIGMVDVRGSSIFASGNDSKYNIFFDMPYPIFKLKIKGFYGQAVTYCLHLTKFTSKFNSNTGNFEITCKLIGHTYAFLTDMLIGHMRGNLFTSIGKQVADEYSVRFKDKTGYDFITFDDYFNLANQAKIGATRIKETSIEGKELKDVSELKDVLEKVDLPIKRLIQTTPTNVYYIGEDALYFVSNAETNENIKADLVSINKEISEFLNNSGGYNYKSIDFDIDFSKNNEFTLSENTIDDLKEQTGGEFDLLNAIGDSRQLKGLSGVTKISYVSFKTFNSQIIKRKEELKDRLKKLNTRVNQLLEANTMNHLSFPATLENMVALITAHVDIYIETIRRVSNNAKTKAVGGRTLTKGGIEALRKDDGIIHPWPLYQIDDTTNENSDGGIYETWIGNSLDDSSNQLDYPEYLYIKELINGIVTVKELDENRFNTVASYNKLWYAVNPLELLANENPYLSINKGRAIDVTTRVLLDRYFIYKNSNKVLSNDDMMLLAKVEANNLYQGLKKTQNQRVINNIINRLTTTQIKSSFTLVNDELEMKSRPYMIPTSGNYTYDYGRKSFISVGDKTFIPLSDNLSTFNIINQVSILNPSKSLYIGADGLSISNTYPTMGDWFNPNDYKMVDSDGGETYLKIIDKSVLDNITNSNELPVYSETKEDLDKMGKGVINGPVFNMGASMPESGVKQFDPQLGTVYYRDHHNLDKTTSVASLFYKNEVVDYDEELKLYHDVGTCSNYFKFISGRNNTAYVNTNINGLYYTQSDIVKSDGSDTRKTTIKKNEPVGLPTQPITLKRIVNLGVQGNEPLVTLKSASFNRNSTARLNQYPTTSTNHLGFYYPDFRFYYYDNVTTKMNFVNLFSSEFYYGQTSEEAKAFLFLHTLPIFHHQTSDLNTSDASGGLFGSDSIKSLFNRNAGVINAPKPWILMLGGHLWRLKQTIDENQGDPITYSEGGTSLIPLNDISGVSNLSYLTHVETNIDSRKLTSNLSFKEGATQPYLERTILALPYQVKDELIREFLSWVSNSYGWKRLKSGLEVFPNATNAAALTTYRTEWDNWFNSQTTPTPHTILGSSNYNTKDYQKIWPLEVGDNFFSELRLGGELQNNIKNFLSDTNSYIVNGSWKIWNSTIQGGRNLSVTDGVISPSTEADLDIYIKSVQSELKKINKKFAIIEPKENKSENVYGTLKSDILHLTTYREIQAIYEKWILGNEGTEWGYNDCVGVNTKTDLIDTFRFIDRGYNDIGNLLKVAPSVIDKNISGDRNQSAYDIIGRILTDNNIDFLPLPSFINFKDSKTLSSMFQPYSYGTPMRDVGPAFICIYSGQKSKRLDLGKQSKYKSDEIDFMDEQNIPPDFNGVPVFDVNFADENQRFFTDIQLDQEEFSETDEGLWIQDEISKRGSETSRVEQEQSLFNVYNTRSYSVDVEMLGNAMIQPFMYFQLNNIPMYHGGYLITKVNHSITPNTMKTNFTGVRIRRTKTPLVNEDYAIMESETSTFTSGTSVTTGNPVFDSARIGYDPIMSSNAEFTNPLTNMSVVSTLKVRNYVKNGQQKSYWHNGYDFADLGDGQIIPKLGDTPVFAVQDGVIERIKLQTKGGKSSGGGLYMTIRHEIQPKNGDKRRIYYTKYMHLSRTNIFIYDMDNGSENLIGGFDPNIRVSKGELIGYVGGIKGDHTWEDSNGKVWDTAGQSGGAHLHFEIREDCAYGADCQIRNPGDYLPALIKDPKYSPEQTPQDIDTA